MATTFSVAFVCSPSLVAGTALPAEVLSKVLVEGALAVASGVEAVVSKVNVAEESSESLAAVEATEGVEMEEAAEDVVVRVMPQTFSTSKVNSMFLASHSSVCLWTESTP